jgi:hypothetical protein
VQSLAPALMLQQDRLTESSTAKSSPSVPMARPICRAPPRLSPLAQARYHRMQAALRRGAEADVGADTFMYEGKLGDRRRAEHKRIKIMKAHAAVDRVDGERKRQPRADQTVQVAVVRIKIRFGGEALRQLRLDNETKGIGGFERIHYVEIVRPGFGEIFPRVGDRISRDEALGPVGGSTVGIIVGNRKEAPNTGRPRLRTRGPFFRGYVAMRQPVFGCLAGARGAPLRIISTNNASGCRSPYYLARGIEARRAETRGSARESPVRQRWTRQTKPYGLLPRFEFATRRSKPGERSDLHLAATAQNSVPRRRKMTESVRCGRDRNGLDVTERGNGARDEFEGRASIEPAEKLGDYKAAGDEPDERYTHGA